MRTAFELTDAFQRGWRESNYDLLSDTLSEDIILLCPTIGELNGKKAVEALYKEERRFPDLTYVAGGDVLVDEEDGIVFQRYDVYLSYDRRISVIDHFHITEGKITLITSISAEWPELILKSPPARD